jgi:hypothetical protein
MSMLTRVDPIQLHHSLITGDGPTHIYGLSNTTKEKSKMFDEILHVDNAVLNETQKVLRDFGATDEMSSENLVHIPVRIENFSKYRSTEDVFLFFPNSKEDGNCKNFSIEFLDVSEWIYQEVVFPLIKKVFVNSDSFLDDLAKDLTPAIFLSSYFHELGHKKGAFKVVPEKDERLKISNKMFALFGETWADVYLLENKKIDNKLFWLFYFIKIFWYARFNFDLDHEKGLLNTDNDSWQGAMFYQAGIESGILSFKEDKTLSFHPEYTENFLIFFRTNFWFYYDDKFLENDESTQNQILEICMSKMLPKSEGQYCYPDELKEIFSKCSDFATRNF